MTINNKSIFLVALFTFAMVGTGCSSLSASKSAQAPLAQSSSETDYYQQASEHIQKEQYTAAKTALNDLLTFYPAGQYAEQALLDLIYVQYLDKDFEAVTQSTSRFLNSYPNSPRADYALYAQGVTNMQGSPKASPLFRLDQSERDTAFLRLAFADFSNLVTYYPNSPYANDAIVRMTDIYNQLAAHELVAAYWYVKRGAYVAAANRAKWVFQYYPRASVTPEAIAILAYANGQLGLQDTAQQYKTLLEINYPQYLTENGNVRLPKADTSPFKRTLSAISFGTLGRSTIDNTPQMGNYQGATKTQPIQSIESLTLPAQSPN